MGAALLPQNPKSFSLVLLALSLPADSGNGDGHGGHPAPVKKGAKGEHRGVAEPLSVWAHRHLPLS